MSNVNLVDQFEFEFYRTVELPLSFFLSSETTIFGTLYSSICYLEARAQSINLPAAVPAV
jgi:heme/copper-type cytochrome/quinol oxidase subunit 3